MTIHTLFPTQVYAARIGASDWRGLNRQLLRECLQLRRDDAAGRRWSARNYPGGFTSYASAHRMQNLSPTFAALAARIDVHVARCASALQFDLRRRPLAMTDCWVNIMGRGATHAGHLHPLASLSGTYYVACADDAPGLKFEDPRLARMMAAPPRRRTARRQNRQWVELSARPGTLLLFESWLRHEVSANRQRQQRVSVSFNYSWF